MFKKKTVAATPAAVTMLRTSREDWHRLTEEIYVRAVAKIPCGMAVVSKSKLLGFTRLTMRLNPAFRSGEATQWVRRHFKVGQFDSIFAPGAALRPYEAAGLYEITDIKAGLPVHCLVGLIAHEKDPDLRAVVLFGGERLEGQLEKSLAALRECLAPTKGAVRDAQLQARREELLRDLKALDLKELSHLDVDVVARLVNELEGALDGAPIEMRSKYRALSDHLVRRRTRERPTHAGA
jgi:hypothetical protein